MVTDKSGTLYLGAPDIYAMNPATGETRMVIESRGKTPFLASAIRSPCGPSVRYRTNSSVCTPPPNTKMNHKPGNRSGLMEWNGMEWPTPNKEWTREPAIFN